ncbi:MAG TPA: alpha/beta hydrolase [Panacibacter sp.]|nr:alpha/beta hydrolase [Panacibacter sp.]
MKSLPSKLLFVLTIIFILSACSKNSTVPNPVIPRGSDSSSMSDVIYAVNKNYLGQNEQLGLDIYFPTNNSTVSKSPLVLFIHGGGFLDGNKKSAKNDCQVLASKGFTVASIDYRLGWTKDNTNPCTSNVDEALNAFYRAQQDARAALRFLVSKAATYSIDVTNIFIVGASSGAQIAMAIPYLTQDSAEVYYPGVSKNLGLLDNAGNNLKNTYSIKGIGCMWGSLINTSLITQQNAVPSIFFHGQQDGVIPWNVGYGYNCSNFPIGYGAKPLYDRLTSLGVAAVAHIDPLGGHGIYDSQFNEENIACFFNSVINGQAQTGFYTTKISSCN